LEKEYNWTGLLIDLDRVFETEYQTLRPNSSYLIQDAGDFDYSDEFASLNLPNNMDALIVDLEVSGGSTMAALNKLDETILGTYKFATVVFEHDLYVDGGVTRDQSRTIFAKYGYVLVFPDVKFWGEQFEDWYVHPDLVDMTLVTPLITTESLDCNVINAILYPPVQEP
jgi:hypothetical protein